MKKWIELNQKEKRKLLAYEKALRENSDEALVLTKYCIENDLCVSQIPQKKLYDDTYRKLHLACPITFADMYSDIIFIDRDGNILEIF